MTQLNHNARQWATDPMEEDFFEELATKGWGIVTEEDPAPWRRNKLNERPDKNVRRRVVYPIGEVCFPSVGDRLDVLEEQSERSPIRDDKAETRTLSFREWVARIEAPARKKAQERQHEISSTNRVNLSPSIKGKRSATT